MTSDNIDLIIEALLFASPEPLTQQKVNIIFENEPPNLEAVTHRLSQQYFDQGNAIEIQNIAGGFQLRTKPEYDNYVRRLLNKTGQLHLSQAALESLSIVAYKQPISRADIEAIRGVDCVGVLKTLLKKSLVKIKGRDEGPGRPLLYTTTDEFLGAFGLNRLSELPKLKEVTELLEEQPALTDQINAFK
ncbi:MAG: SMC-Scp complex subunit ScpB [Candidatus Marinimicrobia bacterium]|nr:SMC-Scp complex subunit ScpB [Candidatus Neomarinimicrobiota bacterium]MBL7010147.1 SMC-Scp complex subunit ScpB [Candidatus Neomarinimicrobiota bacterium]MBL7030412.1 SMC-Scp complex subunit ScpB [Candidatus Neomarinimicrobiota bacterium]